MYQVKTQKCPECQKLLSPKAVLCPSCGAPTRAAAKAHRHRRGNTQALGALLLAGGAVGTPVLGSVGLLVAIVGLVVLVAGFLV